MIGKVVRRAAVVTPDQGVVAPLGIVLQAECVAEKVVENNTTTAVVAADDFVVAALGVIGHSVNSLVRNCVADKSVANRNTAAVIAADERVVTAISLAGHVDRVAANKVANRTTALLPPVRVSSPPTVLSPML